MNTLKPDAPVFRDRYSTFGTQSRDVLIASVKALRSDFNPVQELKATTYNDQCDELCHIYDALKNAEKQ
jgi:hypothetical protein